MAPYSLRGLSFSNTLSRKPLIMGPRGKHSSDAGSGRFTPVSKCFRLATSAPSKTPLTWGTHKMALCAHDTIYWGPQSSAKRRRRAIPAASCCCSGPHLTHFTRGAQCPLSPPSLLPLVPSIPGASDLVRWIPCVWHCPGSPAHFRHSNIPEYFIREQFRKHMSEISALCELQSKRGAGDSKN